MGWRRPRFRTCKESLARLRPLLGGIDPDNHSLSIKAFSLSLPSADVDRLKKLVLHNPVTLTLTEVEGAGGAGVSRLVQQFAVCFAPLTPLHLDHVGNHMLWSAEMADGGACPSSCIICYVRS